MPRTTTRRAAGTALGALAATTALALAAPSATAATTAVVLEPQDGPVLASLGALPSDPAQLDAVLQGGGLPLPDDEEGGEVVLTLPEQVAAEDGLAASFVTLEDALAAELDGATDVEPLLADELELAVADGVVTVTVPADALDEEDRARLDESAGEGVGVLVLDGLVLSPLDGAPVSTAVPLDTTVTDVTGPLELQGLASVSGFLDTVSVEAGGTLDLQVPADGLLASLGLGDLTDAVVTLVDPEEAAEAVGDATDGDGSGTGMGMEGLESLAGLSPDELGVVDAEVVVAPDGASATVTLPEDAAEGTYLLQVAVADAPIADLEGGDLSELGLVAGLVADVEVAAAAPAPTETATPVPAEQNEGLRSNTGVEGGGVDTGLVAAGAGLLAVAAGAGVVGLRTGRRGRA